MDTLDQAARTEFLRSHPDWSLDGETIRRVFVLRDFKEAMGFVTQVALAAETADHHPDLMISYKRVGVTLTTHEAEGLTGKDTALAAEIDGFVS